MLENLNVSDYTDTFRISKTYRIPNTPLGNVYITLSYNGGGGIKEVFIRVGKTKMDFSNNIFELQGLVNGLSILISRLLQQGYDINEIVKSLENINTGWPVYRWQDIHIKSLSDLIAKVIKFDLSEQSKNELKNGEINDKMIVCKTCGE